VSDSLSELDGETAVEIACAVGIDEPECCDGWSETVDLSEPAAYDGEVGRIFLPGFDWECPACGQPHEFEVEGIRVSKLV